MDRHVGRPTRARQESDREADDSTDGEHQPRLAEEHVPGQGRSHEHHEQVVAKGQSEQKCHGQQPPVGPPAAVPLECQQDQREGQENMQGVGVGATRRSPKGLQQPECEGTNGRDRRGRSDPADHEVERRDRKGADDRRQEVHSIRGIADRNEIGERPAQQQVCWKARWVGKSERGRGRLEDRRVPEPDASKQMRCIGAEREDGNEAGHGRLDPPPLECTQLERPERLFGTGGSPAFVRAVPGVGSCVGPRPALPR